MGTPVSSAECRGYRSHPELAAREKGRARRGGARLVPQPRALGAGHRGSDLPAGAAGRETEPGGLVSVGRELHILWNGPRRDR